MVFYDAVGGGSRVSDDCRIPLKIKFSGRKKSKPTALAGDWCKGLIGEATGFPCGAGTRAKSLTKSSIYTNPCDFFFQTVPGLSLQTNPLLFNLLTNKKSRPAAYSFSFLAYLCRPESKPSGKYHV